MAIFYGLESPQYRRQRLFRISKNWSDMAYATLRYQMRGKARLWGHPKALDIVNRNGKWYASIVLEIDDTLLKNSRKGQKKRQKSQLTDGDVETPSSTK